MKYAWSVREALSDSLFENLLAQRGLSSGESREQFLQPQYGEETHNPFLMLGMERAVERIMQAVRSNERVIIFSDYDADGVPGVALLSDFFRLINFTNFDVYIPHRHTEQYGLSLAAIRQFAENGAKLVITIDCGISNLAEVALANELGVDVIVTDHHLCPEVLPRAYAIINPKQTGDAYPEKMLCGTGVIFKVVQALATHFPDLRPGTEKWLLDLVAIATICDRVPLVGENRMLAYFGLKVLRQTRRLGLRALCDSARVDYKFITEDDIGYLIGPRLNSAGRMSHASEAYALLTTTDPAEARALAGRLEAQNGERKVLVSELVGAINGVLAERVEVPVVVAGHPSWSAGVLGLGASRIAEAAGERAVFVWGQEEAGVVKGSCRSSGTVNVVELMTLAGGRDFFVEFGGHSLAGGFALASERVGELEARLTDAYSRAGRLVGLEQAQADARLTLDEVGEEVYGQVERLAPFGHSNPKPVFLLSRVVLAGVRAFGKSREHLELSFKNSRGRAVPAISFFNTLDLENLKVGESIDLLATLERTYFRNYPELRLRIVDVRPAA